MRSFQFVLLPVALLATTAISLPPVQAQNRQDIVETASGAGNFSTLVAAVKAANLVDTLRGDGPFTVFAPTDEAFAKLPEGTLQSLLQPENRGELTAILTYHVLPGRVTAREAFGTSAAATVNGQQIDIRFQDRQLTVDNAKVLATDIPCRNGVIHVIDTVLLPSRQTIPAIAQEAGSFSTLLAAVGTAGLADVLGQPGPFTVFAPTDDAFARLPEGTVEELLKPESRGQLTDILKYHVVAGRVYAADAVRVGRAKTLQGQAVRISVAADGPKVNDAALLTTDIDASNGVIHVIDRVLIPQPMTSREAMTQLQQAIAKGAPAFNHGDRHGCVTIYQQACRTLLDEGGSSMPPKAVQALESAMQQASRTHSMTQRAWALRHGIDRAYSALRDADRMSTAVSR